jgi:hypothetical protein
MVWWLYCASGHVLGLTIAAETVSLSSDCVEITGSKIVHKVVAVDVVFGLSINVFSFVDPPACVDVDDA